ncbi:hypothetical protein WUBG_10886 [Wuchereria bancrofti]|uniref:Uncharacterized protein n=1 Tax=Wuchereria bancrofti TaxID=6293 RepID=J9E7T8_WUCBA|nr:hypothetical protein WUBG_10886 [Wuchereria bancrofti]
MMKLEDERESHILQNAEIKEELTQHEELMEMMEKRFDEQHAKVMSKRDYEREYEFRQQIANDFEICERTKKEIELKMELMDKERDKQSNTIQEYDLKKI